MADDRSAAERYLSARRSSHLRLKLDARCEADTLLAAGFASRGSTRKSMALAVYGVLASEGMTGAWAVADEMGGWLRRRAYLSDQSMPQRTAAIDLAMTVLKHFHHPTCPTCGGIGHPLLANSPVIDSTHECHACHGTGQVLIERLVKPEHIELARWLVDEINSMCGWVFGDIARRLKAEMDLAVK